MEKMGKVRIAEIVRVLDHGTNVQLLCMDARGLLSVYLEPETFGRFLKVVQKAGLGMKGLKIEFNCDSLRVTGLGKQWSLCFGSNY